HTVPGYSTGYADLVTQFEIRFDAPMVWLFPHLGQWVFLSQDYTGAEAPGDFENRWDSVDDAVNDIIDLYFGDPQRMQVKAQRWRPQTSSG
ncbi:MAG TPA: hypothetical protein V6C72_14545, partial [Chroococcales cyanobacterium]